MYKQTSVPDACATHEVFFFVVHEGRLKTLTRYRSPVSLCVLLEPRAAFSLVGVTFRQSVKAVGRSIRKGGGQEGGGAYSGGEWAPA